MREFWEIIFNIWLMFGVIIVGLGVPLAVIYGLIWIVSLFIGR